MEDENGFKKGMSTPCYVRYIFDFSGYFGDRERRDE